MRASGARRGGPDAGALTPSDCIERSISELGNLSIEFYDHVLIRLRAWQAPAPKLREEKAEPADVSPVALREHADEEALNRTSGLAQPHSNDQPNDHESPQPTAHHLEEQERKIVRREI